MTLKTDIKNYKRKLINEASKKGLFENFGQNEVRKLKDKHINSSSYTDEMNEKRDLIRSFDEWAINFDDKQLKEENKNEYI